MDSVGGGEPGISVFSAVILGVVEGITEYLPISSTGHLILAGDALGFTGQFAKSFDIFIQLGAILAVVLLYFDRFAGLMRFSPNERGLEGKRGLIMLALASIPVSLLGVLFHKKIKAVLFFPRPVAMALIFGGIVLWIIESLKRDQPTGSYEDIDYRTSFLIGVFQACSLLPGMSRSACTIVGGMLLGLSRRAAAEFSFILAVPVMCAAVIFDLAGAISGIGPDQIKVLAVGFIVSFVVAAASIRFLLAVISRWSFKPFAVYRIILGAAVLWLSAS